MYHFLALQMMFQTTCNRKVSQLHISYFLAYPISAISKGQIMKPYPAGGLGRLHPDADPNLKRNDLTDACTGIVKQQSKALSRMPVRELMSTASRMTCISFPRGSQPFRCCVRFNGIVRILWHCSSKMGSSLAMKANRLWMAASLAFLVLAEHPSPVPRNPESQPPTFLRCLRLRARPHVFRGCRPHSTAVA